MNLFCNNYKTYMQEIKTNKRAHFASIGISDYLETISCQADKPTHVSYTCRKLSENTQKLQVQTANQQDSRKLPQDRQNKIKKDKTVKQDKSFWPTDIVGDKTGRTLKQFRSYIQTHKINSYIKLNLPKCQTPPEDPQKVVPETDRCETKSRRQVLTDKSQIKIAHSTKHEQYLTHLATHQNQKATKPKKTSTASQKEYQKQKNSSNCSRNSKRVITIDYKVIQIQKTNRKRKVSDSWTSNTYTIRLDNNNKGSNINIGHNKVYIRSEASKEKQLEYVVQKQQFTPNTSTHVRTLNSVDKHLNQDRNNTKKR